MHFPRMLLQVFALREAPLTARTGVRSLLEMDHADVCPEMMLLAERLPALGTRVRRQLEMHGFEVPLQVVLALAPVLVAELLLALRTPQGELAGAWGRHSGLCGGSRDVLQKRAVFGELLLYMSKI